jgi:hypothetical protein
MARSNSELGRKRRRRDSTWRRPAWPPTRKSARPAGRAQPLALSEEVAPQRRRGLLQSDPAQGLAQAAREPEALGGHLSTLVFSERRVEVEVAGAAAAARVAEQITLSRCFEDAHVEGGNGVAGQATQPALDGALESLERLLALRGFVCRGLLGAQQCPAGRALQVLGDRIQSADEELHGLWFWVAHERQEEVVSELRALRGGVEGGLDLPAPLAGGLFACAVHARQSVSRGLSVYVQGNGPFVGVARENPLLCCLAGSTQVQRRLVTQCLGSLRVRVEVEPTLCGHYELEGGCQPLLSVTFALLCAEGLGQGLRRASQAGLRLLRRDLGHVGQAALDPSLSAAFGQALARC